MWHAADVAEKVRHAASYGFKGTGVGSPQFAWPEFKGKRDAYIQRLNGIYERNLEKDGVEEHRGHASLVSPTRVRVSRPDGIEYELNARHATFSNPALSPLPSHTEISPMGWRMCATTLGLRARPYHIERMRTLQRV